MLTVNPCLRITSRQALDDPWIVKYSPHRVAKKDDVLRSLEQLRTFTAESNIQKAVLTYMVGHVISRRKELELRTIFQILDQNKDGQLSKAELAQAYTMLYHEHTMVVAKEVERALASVDFNKNGCIDYNGTVCSRVRVPGRPSQES